MTPEELQAIQARHDRAFNPTVGIVEPMRMPSPGGHLVKLSEGEWQFYLASQKDIPALLAEVQRLKGLVEAAYDEGFNDGRADERGRNWKSGMFVDSNAKRQLEGL